MPALLGRMLADLGATVRKIDICSGERVKSATNYDTAFNVGKSIVSELEAAQYVRGTDVVIWDREHRLPSTWDPIAWHTKLPMTILLTLTPFGFDGPFADIKSSDLVNLAMSGYLGLTGNSGSAPVKPSVPFVSYRHACYHALSGLLLALRFRRLHQIGGHVDVAVRDTGLWMLTNAYQCWDLAGINPQRQGSKYSIGDMSRMMPSLFTCADGSIVWMPLAGRNAAGTIALVAWMEREHAAPAELMALDWSNFELRSNDAIETFLEPFRAFFLTKTRTELRAEAVRSGILLAPVYCFGELCEDPQLIHRGAFAQHNALGALLPRAPVSFSSLHWSFADTPRG